MLHSQIVDTLDNAVIQAASIDQISLSIPLDLATAYAVQSAVIEKCLQRGEVLTGIKMGFTSKAKMEQMGVHDMIWGQLTDRMALAHEGHLVMNELIHPRAEPEIAFLLSKPIQEQLTLDNVGEYVSHVAIALEIIDSRYKNFKFSLEDVVADNCSSARYAIGAWHPVSTPIQDIAMSLVIDGATIEEGNSNAILGNPWESLIAASRLATAGGVQLLPGHLVLAGAATSASYIKQGQIISASSPVLGSVAIHTI